MIRHIGEERIYHIDKGEAGSERVAIKIIKGIDGCWKKKEYKFDNDSEPVECDFLKDVCEEGCRLEKELNEKGAANESKSNEGEI